MATHLKNSKLSRGLNTRKSESGATLIEVMIAMIVLTIGLLGLVASMAWGLSMSRNVRNMSETKLTVTAMLEQMETLRNTGQLTFNQIANTADVVNPLPPAPQFAGFPLGPVGSTTEFQPVSTVPGADGIYGTGDDLLVGGVVDMSLARPGFQRRIEITNLLLAGATPTPTPTPTPSPTPSPTATPSSRMKQIRVTMRYPGRDGRIHEIVGTSYLTDLGGTLY